MLPREWKADRRARRACAAVGKTFDKQMHGMAAGFRMIKETSAAGKLLVEMDGLEAGFRRGDDRPDASSKALPHMPPISPLVGEIGKRRGPSASDLVRLHNRRQLNRWHFTGRLAQMPPPGDWRVWLLMGGRGSGKTRAGAEWVQALALSAPDLRIALVAETLGDGREVMIDGVSGICR
ncbi:terminase large subunit domain-containing protein, partial [Shinella sp.]|uniref:terminase large subunit domain-containing protein n=1 Tax=Shinella sp. TaxID=1870904 RepID=UPI003917B7D4